MKVSLNWMQNYAGQATIMPAGGIDQLVEKIGLQLGAVEGVESTGEKYEGILIVRVVDCQPHPQADKLKVCTIDDGGKHANVERNNDGHIQVVCGAPNVRAGMLAVWLPPGTTVPSTASHEPFTLSVREIRGVVSNGMLASAHELGISDDHSGILEIIPDTLIVKKDKTIDSNDHVAALHNYESKPNYQPGDDFAEAFQLNDYVIDIENKMFTHRPDCFCMLGVARELAGITGQKFTSPAIYSAPKTVYNDEKGLPLEVQNDLPALVPRFMVQIFENVEVKPSPVWLQTFLSRVGVRPINNIVDITNYFMLLTGQPMHAYDYDKVKARSGNQAALVIRHPRAGEELELLNGKTIKPHKDAVMIATDKELIGLGGVMGGATTEVDNETRNIILECANFDMYAVRRTSMEHGLFTDAVTRFSKGQSLLQCDRVLAWAQGEIVCYSGGVPGNVYEAGPTLPEIKPVIVAAEYVNERLGSALSGSDMAVLLTNVEFEVAVQNDRLEVKPPFWRTDIEIADDVVEEIGRLYGYHNLPIELPRRSIRPARRNPILDLKTSVRNVLRGAGANELLTYSFVNGDLFDKAGQTADIAYGLSNALSPDLQYYRLSLTPSLLEKVYPNIRADYVRDEDNDFALFELNKVHGRTETVEGLPREFDRLALVFAADDKTARRKYGGAPYYQARYYLLYLCQTLDINVPTFTPLDKAKFDGHEMTAQMAAPFDPGRSAAVQLHDGTTIGVVGEYKSSVRRSLKLPPFTAGFEIFLSALQPNKTAGRYQAVSRFPRTHQDISFQVPAQVTYQELLTSVSEVVNAMSRQHGYRPVITPLDIYEQDTKHITLRLWLEHPERTLKTEEVNRLLGEVAAVARQKVGAVRL